MWNSRTFPGLSWTFLNKFKGLVYQIERTMLKSFIILHMLYKICFWGKIEPPFLFSNIVISNVNVRLWQTVHSNIFLQLKEKTYPIQGFSMTTTQIPRFSRAWKFPLQIPGLCRIFKYHSNPDYKVNVQLHYFQKHLKSVSQMQEVH